MNWQRFVPPKWLEMIGYGAGILCALGALALSIYWYGKSDRLGALLYVFAPASCFWFGIVLVLGPYQIWRNIRR
jgi:hypothetical protein